MAMVINTVQKFKRKRKVVAVEELPGVPVGTEGKVYYEAGVRWFRYHVAFENGVELSNVDGNALVTDEEWDERKKEARRVELAAEREARNANLVVSSGPRQH